MRKPKKQPEIQLPKFDIFGLSWNYEVKPDAFPILEINLKAFWYGDRYPTPKTVPLTEALNEAIKRGFGGGAK